MTKTTLSIAEIRDLWEYEKETGIFRWKISGRGIPLDKITGHSDGRYIVLTKGEEKLYAHRVAFVLMDGRWPTSTVDHINGDKLDNRFSNLREATQAQNLRNKAVKGDSLTRIKGVTKDRRDGRFYAYIDTNGKRRSLGGFDTPELAEAARKQAEKLYHEGFSYQG